MSREQTVVWSLSQLRIGDRILSLGEVKYRSPRVVLHGLAPLGPASPIWGVRLVPPNASSVIEWVLYPSQCDGLAIVVERETGPGTTVPCLTRVWDGCYLLDAAEDLVWIARHPSESDPVRPWTTSSAGTSQPGRRYRDLVEAVRTVYPHGPVLLSAEDDDHVLHQCVEGSRSAAVMCVCGWNPEPCQRVGRGPRFTVTAHVAWVCGLDLSLSVLAA